MDELTILAEGDIAQNVDVLWHEQVELMPSLARQHVAERWAVYEAAACQQGSFLFNGGITWLLNVHRAGGRIVLELAPGEYKDFVVTVLRDRPWFLEHAAGAQRPALGNSVLMTHGDHALLGIRSPRVSAYAGRAHVIGGVLDQLGTTELPTTITGILAHLRREMHEEANVRDSELAAQPRLLAVARDEILGQPELIWQCELNIDVRDVGRRMDVQEHEAWIVLKKNGVDEETWYRMTPIARGAWQRWSGRHAKV